MRPRVQIMIGFRCPSDTRVRTLHDEHQKTLRSPTGGDHSANYQTVPYEPLK
jgi:hypothetical protein